MTLHQALRDNHFSLAAYDSEHLGPLFAVSDEGSAGDVIVDAAYSSAKAEAMPLIDPLQLGVALDGERMTSAGEVPIGPAEYEDLSDAAAGSLFLTTNVGVRVNARLSQELPEFAVTDESANDQAWLDKIFATFSPFLRTPDGRPRPLTLRLSIDPNAPVKSLKGVASKLQGARTKGRIGSAEVHRFSVLIAFENKIVGDDEIRLIKRVINLAAAAKFEEVALDGQLRQAARRRPVSNEVFKSKLSNIKSDRKLLGQATKTLRTKLIISCCFVGGSDNSQFTHRIQFLARASESSLSRKNMVAMRGG